MQILNGIKCLVFRKQIPITPDNVSQSLPPDDLDKTFKLTQEATVWANLATRLPMKFSTSTEIETYTFLPPPTAQLTLPTEGAKEIAAWETKKAQLEHPGPRP